MKFKIKVSPETTSKASSIFESADMNLSDKEALSALSCVLSEKEALLASCQPQAKNYEEFLADKLWNQISRESSPRISNSISINKFGVFFRSFGMQLSLFFVLGAVVWSAFKFAQQDRLKKLEQNTPIFAALSEMRDEGASDQDLDVWLASVSDSETRYILTSQDLGGLSRSFDHISNTQVFERILNDVALATGVEL